MSIHAKMSAPGTQWTEGPGTAPPPAGPHPLMAAMSGIRGRLSPDELTAELDAAIVGPETRSRGKGELLLDTAALRAIFDRFTVVEIKEADSALRERFGYTLDRAIDLMPPLDSLEFSRRLRGIYVDSADPSERARREATQEKEAAAMLFRLVMRSFEALEAEKPEHTLLIQKLFEIRDRTRRGEFDHLLSERAPDLSEVKDAIGALGKEKQEDVLAGVAQALEKENYFSGYQGGLISRWLQYGYDAPPLSSWDSTRIVFADAPLPGPLDPNMSPISGRFPTAAEILESLSLFGRLPPEIGHLQELRCSCQFFRPPRRDRPLLFAALGGIPIAAMTAHGNHPIGMLASVIVTLGLYLGTAYYEGRRAHSSMSAFAAGGILSRCQDMSLPVFVDYHGLAIRKAHEELRKFESQVYPGEIETLVTQLHGLALLGVPADRVVGSLRDDSFDPSTRRFPGLAALFKGRQAEIGLPDALCPTALQTLDYVARLLRLESQFKARAFALDALNL